jgi:hypothetical protein
MASRRTVADRVHVPQLGSVGLGFRGEGGGRAANGGVDVGDQLLAGGDGRRRRQGLVHRLVDPFLELRADRGHVLLGEDAHGLELPLQAEEGITLAPFLDQRRGHVLGARGFLVAAHTEGLELEQARALAPARPLGRPLHHPVHREHVVAVGDHAGHAVTGGAVGELLARVLLVARGGKAVLVVLDHEEHRQLPDRGQVQGLVEVALARGPVAGEGRDHAVLAPKLRGQGEPVGHRKHRAQVADHAHDVRVEQAEVERAIAALGEPAVLAEELAEQAGKIDPSRGEDPEVPVHGEDGVVRAEGSGHADRDRLLADPGEPLRQPALPEQDQHLLLDHAREEEGSVELLQLLGAEGRLGRARRRGDGGRGLFAHPRRAPGRVPEAAAARASACRPAVRAWTWATTARTFSTGVPAGSRGRG